MPAMNRPPLTIGALFLLTMIAAITSPAPAAADRNTGDGGAVRLREFIYEKAPFPSCHASTIEQLPDGRLAVAWFGGSDEGNDDVGIWFARHDGRAWSKPVEVATGEQPNGKRHPCWNPVLFQPAEPDAPLMLFYKVGPRPDAWWGVLKTSGDGGQTWSDARRLPDGILGPVKNKPVRLKSGRLLCGSSTEHAGWRVHMEWTDDLGKTWHKSEPLNTKEEFGVIQPTILVHNDDTFQILCRSRTGGSVVEAWSKDGGTTWGKMTAAPLVAPSSGMDAVKLKDGRSLLVLNNTPQGRSPLNLVASADGKTWKAALVLEDEPGEYSYPAIIQTADGLVHVTYTWKRERIRHVVIDPAKIDLAKLEDARKPAR